LFRIFIFGRVRIERHLELFFWVWHGVGYGLWKLTRMELSEWCAEYNNDYSSGA